MQRSAGARRRIGDLAGILLGEIDHVLPGLERRFGAGGDAEGVAGEMDDVGKILGRIPGDFLHQRQAEYRDRQLRDGVAVGLGSRRHGGRADGAAAAGLVVDRDRLAQHLRGAVGDRAHRNVGRSARRPRHDQGDRLGRIFLRAGGWPTSACRCAASAIFKSTALNIELSPLRPRHAREADLVLVHGSIFPENDGEEKHVDRAELADERQSCGHTCDNRPAATSQGAELWRGPWSGLLAKTDPRAPCGRIAFGPSLPDRKRSSSHLANAGIAGKPA